MEINICHLYYDILNLYGDNGNILSMKNRLAWRGIDSHIDRVSFGAMREQCDYDIVFIGGGQDFEQDLLVKDLMTYKAEWMLQAIENGTVFLGICGGYQLLGKYYEMPDGKRVDFLGGINVHTTSSPKRLIGNIAFRCEANGELPVVGFENHSGQTWLGEGVEPLGTVVHGFGNNGEDGTEGARYKNVFATYSHGPLLPKNPQFCDTLLQTALSKKYPGYELTELDDSMETMAAKDCLQVCFGGE